MGTPQKIPIFCGRNLHLKDQDRVWCEQTVWHLVRRDRPIRPSRHQNLVVSVCVQPNGSAPCRGFSLKNPFTVQGLARKSRPQIDPKTIRANGAEQIHLCTCPGRSHRLIQAFSAWRKKQRLSGQSLPHVGMARRYKDNVHVERSKDQNTPRHR
jgi:hypothetical protein